MTSSYCASPTNSASSRTRGGRRDYPSTTECASADHVLLFACLGGMRGSAPLAPLSCPSIGGCTHVSKGGDSFRTGAVTEWSWPPSRGRLRRLPERWYCKQVARTASGLRKIRPGACRKRGRPLRLSLWQRRRDAVSRTSSSMAPSACHKRTCCSWSLAFLRGFPKGMVCPRRSGRVGVPAKGGGI